MLETKAAISAKIMADDGPDGLATLLFNAASNTVRFYYDGAEVSIDDAAAAYPEMIYKCIRSPEDDTIPRIEETYQFDIFSRDPDVNDRIARRLRRLFHKKHLAVAAPLRFGAMLVGVDVEMPYDGVLKLHQHVVQFLVIVFNEET